MRLGGEQCTFTFLDYSRTCSVGHPWLSGSLHQRRQSKGSQEPVSWVCVWWGEGAVRNPGSDVSVGQRGACNSSASGSQAGAGGLHPPSVDLVDWRGVALAKGPVTTLLGPPPSSNLMIS